MHFRLSLLLAGCLLVPHQARAQAQVSSLPWEPVNLADEQRPLVLRIAHVMGIDEWPGRWPFDIASVQLGDAQVLVVRAVTSGGTGGLVEAYAIFPKLPYDQVNEPSLALLRHILWKPFEHPDEAFSAEGCLRLGPPGLLGYLFVPDSTVALRRALRDTVVLEDDGHLRLGHQSGYYGWNKTHTALFLTREPDLALRASCLAASD